MLTIHVIWSWAWLQLQVIYRVCSNWQITTLFPPLPVVHRGRIDIFNYRQHKNDVDRKSLSKSAELKMFEWLPNFLSKKHVIIFYLSDRCYSIICLVNYDFTWEWFHVSRYVTSVHSLKYFLLLIIVFVMSASRTLFQITS